MAKIVANNNFFNYIYNVNKQNNNNKLFVTISKRYGYDP